MNASEERKKELQKELESIQSEIESSLHELKEDIDSWLDARYWIHRYPLHSVGAAALAGLMLAYFTGGRSAAKTSKMASIFTNEFKKFAARKAARYLVARIESNLETKTKKEDPES